MNLITQVIAVVAMNLRSLPQRLGTSLVIIIGSGGVVAVLVCVLAMAAGMTKHCKRPAVMIAPLSCATAPRRNPAAHYRAAQRKSSWMLRASNMTRRASPWHPRNPCG